MTSYHNLIWSEIVRQLTPGMSYPIELASSSCGRNVHDREKPFTSTCKWYGIYMQCMAHCRAHTFEGRALRSENVECMYTSRGSEQEGLYSGGVSCCYLARSSGVFVMRCSNSLLLGKGDTMLQYPLNFACSARPLLAEGDIAPVRMESRVQAIG